MEAGFHLHLLIATTHGRHAAALFSPGDGNFCKYIDFFAESDIIEPRPMGSSYGISIRLSSTARRSVPAADITGTGCE